MAKLTKETNQLNMTVVALVALVAIVGLVALVLNAASLAAISENVAVTSEAADHEPFPPAEEQPAPAEENAAGLGYLWGD